MISALADGESSITGLSPGEDVAATSVIVEQLGATRYDEDGVAYLRGPEGRVASIERSTRLRELRHDDAAHVGRRELDSRRASPHWRPVALAATDGPRGRYHSGRWGSSFAGAAIGVTAPLFVTSPARVRAIDYHVPVASAQVKSAILLAGLTGDGETRVSEDVRTRRTTEEMLAAAGVHIDSRDVGDGREVTVRPGRPRRHDWHVPGDPSQAAFFAVLGAVHPDATLEVLSVDSSPERVGFVHVLERMGAAVALVDHERLHRLRAKSSALSATEIHAATSLRSMKCRS